MESKSDIATRVENMNNNHRSRLLIILTILVLIPILTFLLVLSTEGHVSLAGLLGRLTLAGPLDLLVFLLAIAVVIAIVRVFLFDARSAPATAHRCPRCGGELQRIHRTAADRLLSVIVNVHRYRCADPRCNWQGLRRRRHTSRHPPAAPPPAAT